MTDEDLEPRVRGLEVKDAADRERLLGLLERAERELFPLVEMYGRLDERFNTVLRDVGKAHEAIRELEDMIETEREERRRGQAERKQELEAAVTERRSEMAAAEERARRSEQEARDREKTAEEARQLQHNELKSRLRVAVIVLGGTMMSSGVTVLVAIITARGGK